MLRDLKRLDDFFQFNLIRPNLTPNRNLALISVQNSTKNIPIMSN